MDARAYIDPSATRFEIYNKAEVKQFGWLIECWMGEKWGLKFPLSPHTNQPREPEQLVWRTPQITAVTISHTDTDYLQQKEGKIAIGFDLSLPLKQQMESAKQRLIKAQKNEAFKQQQQTLWIKWTDYLRIFDAHLSGANENEIVSILAKSETNQWLNKALKHIDKLINKEFRFIAIKRIPPSSLL